MAELSLKIVIENLNKLKKQFEDSFKTTNTTSSGSGKTSSGGSGGGKSLLLLGGIAAAVIGIFASLESVISLLTIVSSLVNYLVAPFVPFLITVLKPVVILLSFVLGLMLAYYKNPVQSLIKLGVFIVNGVIAGLELLTNFILGIFGKGPVEFPRLQQVLVDEAFNRLNQELERADEDGTRTFKESFNAFTMFAKDMNNTFVKTSELTQIIENGVIKGLDEVSILGAILEVGGNNISDIYKTAFDNMQKAAELLISKSDKLINTLSPSKSETSTGRNFTPAFYTPVKRNIQDILPLSSNRVNNTTVNFTVQGNADAKTAELAASMIRRDLNRRGAF